jgi:hypothetical protein
VPEQAEQTLILATRLRGIKEADPAEFFPKDPLGGQTLDNMHWPLAVGTLLDFSLWYLKENGFVARQDNGRFTITATGVDWAEKEEAREQLRADRLLTASSA